MADPKGMTEIEDVLSSIRRLVAAETRKTGTAPEDGREAPAEDALVLTPAQRVDEAGTDAAADADAPPPASDTLKDWEADAEAELSAGTDDDTASLEQTLAELEAALQDDPEDAYAETEGDAGPASDPADTEVADAGASEPFAMDEPAEEAAWVDEGQGPAEALIPPDLEDVAMPEAGPETGPEIAETAETEAFEPAPDLIDVKQPALEPEEMPALPDIDEPAPAADFAETAVEPALSEVEESVLPDADMGPEPAVAEPFLTDAPAADASWPERAPDPDADQDADAALADLAPDLSAPAEPAAEAEDMPAQALAEEEAGLASPAPHDAVSGTGLEAESGFLLTEPSRDAPEDAPGKEPRRGFIWVGGFDEQAQPEPVAEITPLDLPADPEAAPPPGLPAEAPEEAAEAREPEPQDAAFDPATPDASPDGALDLPEAEAFEDVDALAEPEPDMTAEAEPEEAVEAEPADDTPEPAPEPDPVLAAVPVFDDAAEDEDADMPGLFDAGDDLPLDEAALREIVAEIIRDELRGALGDRLGRNLRKMVRQEIRAALAAQGGGGNA